jgi:hypothetical protein
MMQWTKAESIFYNQWLWLTQDDILALQYRPEPGKQKIVPLSRGVPYPCHKVQGNVL